MLSGTVCFPQPGLPAAERQKASTTHFRVSQPRPGQPSVLDTQGADSFQPTRKTTAVKPQFSGASPRQKGMMKRHINKGIELIRDGKYEEAVEHFQNRERLGEMDVDGHYPVCVYYRNPSISVEDAKRLVNRVALRNMAFNIDDELSIKFGRILFLNEALHEPAPGTPEANIVNYVHYEQALMAAEENIHTYQNMDDGKNVTYHPAAGEETLDDYEIDIATTLERFGLPLTQEFLKRYKDRAKRIQADEALDLREISPGNAAWVAVPIDKGVR